MTVVKRIEISGFRGLLAPLPISFEQGGKLTSVVVYGRNGTGKSSITDAWEWLRTLRIDHLAREGAKETSYPHKEAKPTESFVQVDFADSSLGTVRAVFDPERVTKPRITGNYRQFVAITPHPFFVRFADLTRFVYQTKSERYDVLAQLMGFQPQVDYQKVLRRVQKNLAEKRDKAIEDAQREDLEATEALKIPKLNETAALDALGKLVSAHGVTPPKTMLEARIALAELQASVDKDPLAIQLAVALRIRTALGGILKHPGAAPTVAAYLSEAIPFKEQEEALRKLLMIELYSVGQVAIERVAQSGHCPLCGQVYAGDLRAHLTKELQGLEAVQKSHSRVTELWHLAREAADGIQSLAPGATADVGALAGEEVVVRIREIADASAEHSNASSRLVTELNTPPDDLDTSGIERLRLSLEAYSTANGKLGRVVTAALGSLEATVARLQADSTRQSLVSDYATMSRALSSLDKARLNARRAAGFITVSQKFERVADDFVQASLVAVQKRFDRISTAVTEYFELLEIQTVGISKPILRLPLDQERAVVPEVLFHGEAIAPAYKYLSESQLNSFGLAVFLASVREFNPGFRFIVLDDVVNSLDGYKRPQLIRILKTRFANYQILLLTHDTAWRDRIQKECAQWKRVHFARYEYGIGPIVLVGETELEAIARLLDNDKPKVVGQMLGPYLEGELQELAEYAEVELKFNRRNEYTLDPLLDGVRSRISKKLGPTHPLSALLDQLRAEGGFRNLTAHQKNPAIEITTEEMKQVVATWNAIEAMVTCGNEACGEKVRFVDGGFACSCRKTVLTKAAP